MSEIKERVIEVVSKNLDVDKSRISEDANFVEDLGADSLDQVELVMAFEEEFGVEIPDEAAEKIRTISDAVKFIEENSK